MDKVLFIDLHNAIWRACIKFTSPQFFNDGTEESQTEDDSIIFTFNFFRNLRPLIELFKPDKCFAVLEGHPQFRYDLFADYKANRIIKRASRQEANDIFLKAKDIIINLMQHLPITMARAIHYEADDLIGSLCENMKEENLTIISGDSDYIQLLQRGYSNIRIYNPIKKIYMDAPPYPYIAWKALSGDKSDNIPGLLKPKKALNTITNPELFKKFMEMEENRANFSINRQLIEFKSVPEEEIILKEGIRNFKLLQQSFAEMKFESIINSSSWDKYVKTFNCLKY